MRFTFSDAARARRLAKLLKSTLASHGIDWPLHACREAVAEACGYPSFFEIEASAGSQPPSPVDAEVPGSVRAERREAQRAALARRGIPAGVMDGILAAVPFTGSFRAGPAPAGEITRHPTPRQGRIARSGSRVGAMRAGNFNACTLVDADGGFLGIAFGTDMSHVHDDPPDGFLEAFGAADGAATVGEARLPAATSGLVTFSDPGDDSAMTLHLNRDLTRYATPEWFRSEAFTDPSARTPWRFNGTPGERPDLVTAWSHSGLALAAFGAAAKARLIVLREAVTAGDVAMAYDRMTGPILVIASRFDPDLELVRLADAALAATVRTTSGLPVRAAEARLDLDGPHRSARPR